MPFEHGYALLIGVDQNRVAEWALPDVSKDLAALSQVLTHEQRCAYSPDHVRVVTGPQATREGILEGLSWLQEQLAAQPGDETSAVIYYSGHGWRAGAAGSAGYYLIPYDVRANQIAPSALRAADFAAAVDSLQPRRLLVLLDCCHAGGMGVKGAPPELPGYTPAAAAPTLLMGGEVGGVGPGAKGLDRLSLGSGRAVLCSSTGTQQSFIRSDGAMSIFTYHVIEALTGHAAPAEGATEVLVSDVMSYVSRHVPDSARQIGAEQTPDFRVSGNFAVAKLLGGKGLAPGARAPDPLAPLPGAGRPGARHIDTGGGAYVEGNVRVRGGNFVGRDQIIRGDQVQGDKITVGDISGSNGVAIGRGARASVNHGATTDLASLFADVYRRIEARPPDPDVERDEITRQVRQIEQEAARGAMANPAKIERWLGTLSGMADDIARITAACLLHPSAGIAEAVREAVQKARL